MQVQLNQDTIKTIAFTSFVLVGLLILAQSLHEVGHIATCTFFGAKAVSNFLSYNLCEFQTEPSDFAIFWIRVFGGATPVIVGLTTLCFVKHRLVRLALFVVIGTHATLGVMEVYFYDWYATNTNGVAGYTAYLIGLITAFSLSRFKLKKGVRA